MGRQELTRPDPSSRPALGESRARVLTLLRSDDAPATVMDIARRVGLHSNTTRFHLDGLVEQGLAEREIERREVPGRPRTLYRASADGARAGRRSYRLLAEVLIAFLATHTRRPGQLAMEAGEACGRSLVERPASPRRVGVAAATDQLVEVLEEIGFAPEAVTARRERRILLHECPFREVAEKHPGVVCAVHLGIMRGLLDELGAPIDVAGLDSFVEPSLCVTRLSAAAQRAPVRRGAAADPGQR